MDNNPLISPEIVPTPQTQNNSFQPPSGQPIPPPENLSGKPRRKKLTLIATVLILVLAGGIIYYFVTKNVTTTKTAGNETNQQLASAKPQFSNGDSVAGYLKYDSTKLKEVQSVGLPSVKSTDPNVNVVIVSSNYVSYGESGLYLYDLTTNKNYKLTSGGGDPRIISDHFLMYGFDEGSGADRRLGAKLLNLNDGQIKTIFSGPPETMTGTVCCSVSPDGFKLAWPLKDKISVWDIRTGATKDYAATVAPISETFERDDNNDYATEIGYPPLEWVDNDTIAYADKTAHEGKANTNLYYLTLKDGKNSELATGNSAIYNIYVRGGNIFVLEVTADEEDQISQTKLPVGTPPEVIAQLNFTYTPMFSPQGDKLYLFDDSYMVVDTKTKKVNQINPTTPEISHIDGVIPKGWAGPDRMIVDFTDVTSNPNHEYIAIYNTTTDQVEQYTTVK